MYLTDITFIEEGSSDYLHEETGDGSKGSTTNLINFGKRRMVARSTREVQLYQDQPYCLEVVPDIEVRWLCKRSRQGLQLRYKTT